MRAPTQRIQHGVAVLLAAIVGVIGAIGADAATPESYTDPARVTQTAVRVQPPDRVLMVSDSAWLGIKLFGAVDSLQGSDLTMALASCRRRVSASCRNYNGFVPITMRDELLGQSAPFTTLLVATGYNDSDHNFADDVATITALARSRTYKRIVWMTLRSNVAYTSPDNSGNAAVFERANAALRQIVAAGDYPEIVIADWETYARDRPEWFASDGIHLRNAGPYAAGDYISRKLAFLDGHACAQPAAAGQAPIDPCPDPDVHGPTIDLDSLYPIGQEYPREPFVLVWEGSSSWPRPPWWERES